MFGILNLHKPVGPTSRDCVNAVQRLIHPTKVGHAGTLDPLASGVLLVLIGQAVRLTDAIHTLPKQYLGSFELGVTNDSADSESTAVPIPSPPIIQQHQIEQQLPSFTGIIEQTPPKYSAIWIDGKRAHELAREGKEFEIPKRDVTVASIELTAFKYPHFELKITCGTGTYIRSIGRDIALALGSDAIMTSLVRTAIGPFLLENSCSPDALEEESAIAGQLMPSSLGVKHWPQAFPNDETLVRLEQGKRIDQSDFNSDALHCVDFAAALDSSGRLRALIKRIDGREWRADKCFLLSQG